MKTCTNCNGDGIVGSGDQPWLKQGHLVGCKACGGTGKAIEDADFQFSTVKVDEPKADESSDDAADAVDNSGSASADQEAPKANGILAGIKAFFQN